MQKLNQRQQKFVNAIVELGGQWGKHSEAARRAGYTGSSQTISVTANRLLRDPGILAAIHEETVKRINAGTVLGAGVVVEIANNPLHKDQFKAALWLLEHNGFHTMTEHKVTVDDKRTEKEMIAQAIALADRLGIDPAKLLGRMPKAIEVGYSEVKKLPPPEPAIEADFEDADDLMRPL